jgi:hypothetical protein
VIALKDGGILPHIPHFFYILENIKVWIVEFLTGEGYKYSVQVFSGSDSRFIITLPH